jgi:hypothetical protein
MHKILSVVQDKGGVGKSTIVRALKEAVPGLSIFEVDSAPRLLELKSSVRHFPMRANREEVERTGGRAARAQFDSLIDAISKVDGPTAIDVGANTGREFLGTISDLRAAFADTGIEDPFTGAGIEFGVLVVVTAEPGAIAEAPALLNQAKSIATARFILENRMRGDVDPKLLAKFADGATHLIFEDQPMDDDAVGLLQAGGLASIGKLDPAKINEKFGIARGSRICRDLMRFRVAAMEAVREPATWLIS